MKLALSIAGTIVALATAMMLAPHCHPGDRAIVIGGVLLLAGCAQ